MVDVCFDSRQPRSVNGKDRSRAAAKKWVDELLVMIEGLFNKIATVASGDKWTGFRPPSKRATIVFYPGEVVVLSNKLKKRVKRLIG
ncbi:hypothetical protein MPC1_16070002 [Methylocella tundrae]|nr:hypothetical protein MPC1_16070002 [Methylocella tundrae]